MLVLGGGAGLTPMLALRAGAHHVTVAERWLYLAMASKESLLANGYSDDQAKVSVCLNEGRGPFGGPYGGP